MLSENNIFDEDITYNPSLIFISIVFVMRDLCLKISNSKSSQMCDSLSQHGNIPQHFMKTVIWA